MWWFMYVYVISPGFLHHFGVKFGDFDVYVKTPGFSVCFQTISNRISLEIMAQMRSAGEFTSILHRCPRAKFPPKCTHAGVYAILLGVSWNFHKMFAQISHESHADLRFAGDFTSIWRRCPGTFPLPDCAFMMFRRGFRIISELNRQISMFMT
jgi:hypothetical protein